MSTVLPHGEEGRPLRPAPNTAGLAAVLLAGAAAGRGAALYAGGFPEALHHRPRALQGRLEGSEAAS